MIFQGGVYFDFNELLSVAIFLKGLSEWSSYIFLHVMTK